MSFRTTIEAFMTKEYLIGLFEYNFEVNNSLCKVIADVTFDNHNLIKLFAHILSAEKIWLMRLCSEDLSKELIWPNLSLADCKELISVNKMSYHVYLKDKTDKELKSKLFYKSTKGIKFSTPVIDILMHVIIHSGYHRGQIAAELRKKGGKPINTDYIHYIRYNKR
jgi:uncharacterized damage-inducible protein DinB